VARELGGLAGPRQHRDAGEHDFRTIDMQPNLAQRTLDIARREADGVRIVEDAAEKVPGSKWRTLVGVVDHKIVYENEPARRQGSEGALRQDGHVMRADQHSKGTTLGRRRARSANQP